MRWALLPTATPTSPSMILKENWFKPACGRQASAWTFSFMVAFKKSDYFRSMSRKYKFNDQEKLYFVSFATMVEVQADACARVGATQSSLAHWQCQQLATFRRTRIRTQFPPSPLSHQKITDSASWLYSQNLYDRALSRFLLLV